MCGGSPVKQCEGLFGPKLRIYDHYHSQAAEEFISRESTVPVKESTETAPGCWAPVIFIIEDNTTCIIAYKTGKTLR